MNKFILTYNVYNVPFIDGHASVWRGSTIKDHTMLPKGTVLEFLYNRVNGEHAIYFSKEKNESYHINRKSMIKWSMPFYYNCNKIWNELNA